MSEPDEYLHSDEYRLFKMIEPYLDAAIERAQQADAEYYSELIADEIGKLQDQQTAQLNQLLEIIKGGGNPAEFMAGVEASNERSRARLAEHCRDIAKHKRPSRTEKADAKAKACAEAARALPDLKSLTVPQAAARVIEGLGKTDQPGWSPSAVEAHLRDKLQTSEYRQA